MIGYLQGKCHALPQKAMPDASASSIGNLQARLVILEHKHARMRAKSLEATELLKQSAKQKKQLADNICRVIVVHLLTIIAASHCTRHYQSRF